jgi:prepilin-type processing-associated H-X9-DG protein
LVVIAIIAILLALSIAGLARAKGKALQSQCVNNVRQLGLALRGFVIENNHYPLVIKPSWIEDLQHTELSTSANHVNSRVYLQQGVWQCPSAHRPDNLPQNKGYVSYGYNFYGMSTLTDTNSLGLGGHYVWSGSRWPAPPVNESEVSNPSEMIGIGDGFLGDNGVVAEGVFALGRTHSLQGNSESTKRANSRHQGKADIVFCDGHVGSPTLKFLFKDTSDGALAQWNRDHQPHREKLQP